MVSVSWWYNKLDILCSLPLYISSWAPFWRESQHDRIIHIYYLSMTRVFVNLHITAQPSPRTHFFLCYLYTLRDQRLLRPCLHLSSLTRKTWDTLATSVLHHTEHRLRTNNLIPPLPVFLTFSSIAFSASRLQRSVSRLSWWRFPIWLCSW